MIWKTLNVLVLLTGFCIFTYSQSAKDSTLGSTADTAAVNRLLQQSKGHFSDNPAKAISLAMEAKNLAEKIKFSEGTAFALKNIGLGYYYQGKYLEALQNWNESLAAFKQIKDETGEANLLNNIAAIYTQQGDDEKGLEYSLKSLAISEKLKDKLRILSALNTVGSIYFNKKATWDKALNYLLMALPYCEELGNSEALGTISENIGEIYFEKNDFTNAISYFEKSIKALGESPNSSFAYTGIGKVYLQEGDITHALSYNNKALAIAEKFNSKPNIVRALEGIAQVYVRKKDYSTALGYLSRAKGVAGEIKAAPDLKDIYRDMAESYAKIQDYKNAFTYQTLYSDIKDTLYSYAADKKLGSLQFEFDLEKKQSQINLLTKDKALTALELNRQKFVTNAFMVGLTLAFMIAVLVFRSYLIKKRTNKILDRQKMEIESLLLNILPAEVAKELQVKGYAEPKYYESVAVLFTDFKGFTLIADKMSPQELLEELNVCFLGFDAITEKYNLEKIKTIGDSYMCAGGIPTLHEQHVESIVHASLEIRDFILDFNQKRKEAGSQPWDMRIGIHVGPVVAGVVGKKKYVYDIWGSTVNIASRMESNGLPGQVNISSAVYELVKDKFHCSYRGKIQAKNIGEIDMYFVSDDTKVSNADKSKSASDNGIVIPLLQNHKT
ncbi:MAG: adenylate/guanylate cyclase domain-containing protein [Ginsengibacter sp.]